MKGMSGMEVLQKVRQMVENARGIVATADIQKSTQELTLAEDAEGFVTKPFVENEILTAVDSALKEP